MVYLVFIDAEWSQVGVVEQLVGDDIDGRLPASFIAQHPLRIDEAPEGRTCGLTLKLKIEKKQKKTKKKNVT